MTTRARNLVITCSLMAVTLVVGGILFFNQPPTPSVPVRIGYLNITASLPLFIAEEKGFFKEEGIDIQTTPIATSNQLVDAVVAGNLDAFPEASAVPVLAVDVQAPGRLKVFSVSAITKQAPFDALLVKDGSPIMKLSDLAGRKVGVFPGSTAAALLKKYLTDNQVDVSRISFVPLPPQNQLGALQEGAIDALHAYEPTTAIALNKGGVRKLFGSVYAEMLDPNPQGVAVISSKFVKAHPDIAKRSIRAFERAMQFMRDNRSEASQILAKRLTLAGPVAESTVFLYMTPHKEIDAAAFQKYADMLKDLGELKGRVNVDQLIYRD